MVINVSVQYNGGLLSDIVLLTQTMLSPSGNPFKCHEEVLYLQPLIPPKHFYAQKVQARFDMYYL